MVRRRTRAVRLATSAVNSTATTTTTTQLYNGGSTGLCEDQYFASPKRKDCKVDTEVLVAHNDEILTEPYDHMKHDIGNKSIGKISGNARTRTKTIESFFRVKTDDNTNLGIEKDCIIQSTDITMLHNNNNNTKSMVHSPREELFPSEVDGPTHNVDYIFEIDDADDNDEDDDDATTTTTTMTMTTEASKSPAGMDDCGSSSESCVVAVCNGGGGGESSSASYVPAMVDFITRRSRDSNSSSSCGAITNTENIFLQEPVLTLNVDKSPNQASSIKINRSIPVEAIFSSPPSSGATLNGLNCFNQIVSLNGSIVSPTQPLPVKWDNRHHHHQSVKNGGSGPTDTDNSSCDSGVVFVPSLDNSSPFLHTAANNASMAGRRRKPTTPHRIVCPSPVKSMPRMNSPVHPVMNGVCGSMVTNRKDSVSKEQLSPRKSPRHNNTPIVPKTRRRLHHPQQQHHQQQQQEQQQHQLQKQTLPQTLSVDNNIDQLNIGLKIPDRPVNIRQSGKSTSRTIKSSNTNTTNTQTTQTRTQTTKHQPRQQLHQPLSSTNGNRELTEFFPVRRSVRKTKTAVKEEMMRSLEQAVIEERSEGLKIAYFENKGRGIVAERRFQRGEFVIEYVGDLISPIEAGKRETQYALDENAGCYMYYFKHKNQQYCIDATIDTGKLGRLVNHSRNGNLITKVVMVKQRPHLILIAKDDIETGEELTYDYGDRSKESLLHHPWLAF